MTPEQHRAVAQTIVAIVASLDSMGMGLALLNESKVTLITRRGTTYAYFHATYPDGQAGEMGVNIAGNGDILGDGDARSVPPTVRLAAKRGETGHVMGLGGPLLEDALTRGIATAERAAQTASRPGRSVLD